MIDFASYFGLFAAALGAVTILPMQSEPLLVGGVRCQDRTLRRSGAGHVSIFRL